MVHVSKDTKNLLSHPDKKLYVHMTGVCDKAMIMHPDYRVRTSSLIHDCGKASDPFQIKINGGDASGLYSNHSYLSFLTLVNYLAKHKFVPGVINNFYDFLIIAACIVKHHGSMPNFGTGLGDRNLLINFEEVKRMNDFLGTGPKIPVDELLSLMKLDKNIQPFQIQARPDIEYKKIFSHKERLDGEIKDKLSFFFDLRMCFSALVSADKLDASKLEKEFDPKIHRKFLKRYPKNISTYLKTLKPDSDLNILRTDMREVALSNLSLQMDLQPEQRLFSLTYPTGAGKTAIMLALAEEILKRKGERRIIYSVPFLSITEQIFGIIKDQAFKKDTDGIKRIDCKAAPTQDLDLDASEEAGTWIAKAEKVLRKILKGKTLKDEKIDGLRAQDYLESTFNYPLIVTTFVQFFQSFTTSSNRGLMRYAGLKNCIFLIDEYQALSPVLYTFFVALLDEFCRKYDSYAILSTATMPAFDIPSRTNKDVAEMFPNFKLPVEIGDLKFYDHPLFNRYDIGVLSGTYDTTSIASLVMREAVPTMVILNTIADSIDVYDNLKTFVKCPVYLLNTNFYSKERRRILRACIKHIRRFKNKETSEPFFLVCTQLVEAGVDIDFDVVYRDIAPLPNIIQAAGRCNRNGKLSQKGKVYVFKLVDSKHKLRAGCIYNGPVDGPFLSYADQILYSTSKRIFEEKELLNIQKGFFGFVNRSTSFGDWDGGNFVDQINSHQYGDIGTYTVIPPKRYGIQEQFYVPESDDDDAFEKLIEFWAEKMEIDQRVFGPKEDKYRYISFINKRNDEHLKKMMDRVVQANIDPALNFMPFVEYDQMFFHLWKLKPGVYNYEYGLHF